MLARQAVAEPIEVSSQPIAYFSRAAPGQTEFGLLTFRGGLVLTSKFANFGGFSGLRVKDDGTLIALSDRAHWLTGTLIYDGTRPSGIAEAEMFPVLGASGKKLAGTRLGDVEGLEVDGNTAWVGIERKHQVVRFDLSKGVGNARAAAVKGAKGFADLPYNEGLEALGIVPGGTEKGALLVISEAGLDKDGNHRAWLLPGKSKKPIRALSVKRRDEYAITDLAFLPVSGDLVILERRYRPPFGLNMRLRRIRQADIAENAVLDGEVLIEASLSHEIDNMEGISAHHAPDGASVLTIISDNNFGGFQRNVLLQFSIGDSPLP
jgi:hypothetical protein